MSMPEYLEELANKLREKLGVETIRFVLNPLSVREKEVGENEAVCYVDPIIKVVVCKVKDKLHVLKEQDLQ